METETTTSLTDIYIEALQNLSSMYNSGTVPNIKVTGYIDITGGIKAIEKIKKIKGKYFECSMV
jgi:hypothetical protein